MVGSLRSHQRYAPLDMVSSSIFAHLTRLVSIVTSERHIHSLREEREPVELAPREDKSPSNSGTSYSGAGGSSGAPDGRFEDSVEEYVQPGCSEGSFNSRLGSGSIERRTVDVGREASVKLLRLVDGLAFVFGLKLFAFRRLDVHHNCRSSASDEVIELRELVTEGVVECRERSFAIRSLR